MPRFELRRLAVAACAVLAGCNDTLGLAPATPQTPWDIHVLAGGAQADARPGAEAGAQVGRPAAAVPHFAVPHDASLPWRDDEAGVDPAHVYCLAELIDVAQRRNKQTRIAWEQARQAAIGVGISRAAFLPGITASALAGYQHVASPFPSNLAPRGYITANSEEFLPELAIRYLLLDFGRRRADEAEARQLSFAANAGFTWAHQSLILNVARAYFTLDGVNAQYRALQQALSNARTLQQSAETMQAHGLGTVVATQLARRGTAQALFDVSAAKAAQHNATYTLLEALSLPPTTRLLVQDSSSRPLPHVAEPAVDELMQTALQNRPDLLASLGRLRAAEAGIARARADLRPSLGVEANIQGNIGQISVDGLPYDGIRQPQAGVFLRFNWPLYQGGLLRNRLRLAQSQRAEAEDALEEGSDTAMRQVALAYDQLDTGLDQYAAAVALQSASQAAFDAARDAYAHGVGTFTDAETALSALAAARAAMARAHAQSLINAAALAFATGALTSSNDVSADKIAP